MKADSEEVKETAAESTINGKRRRRLDSDDFNIMGAIAHASPINRNPKKQTSDIENVYTTATPLPKGRRKLKAKRKQAKGYQHKPARPRPGQRPIDTTSIFELIMPWKETLVNLEEEDSMDPKAP